MNVTDGLANGVDLIDAVSGEIPNIVHIVKFAKDAGRALDDKKSDLQFASIMNAAMTQAKTRAGWSVAFTEPMPQRRYSSRGDSSRGYVYSVELTVSCVPTKLRGTIGQEFVNILATMDDKAKLPANRWRIAEVDGVEYIPTKGAAITVDSSEEIGYVPFEIPADHLWYSETRDGSGAFDHLYGMEDYVAIIKATLEAAVKSRWEQRVNIELVGPPACGKSELCKALKRLLGAESVLEFDGTSTTMAGAQQELSEREELPRVLLIEEIEKAPESSLPWLLSVLDLRGEVRKTTARGNILKEVHMVGICTVNNEEVFDNLASGALASRFSMPLTFRRPTREILWKILYREINKCDGDEAWIEPTLEYAEKIGLTDPRKMIAICLTGRERLLDGSWQAMLTRTSGIRTTYEFASGASV